MGALDLGSVCSLAIWQRSPILSFSMYRRAAKTRSPETPGSATGLAWHGGSRQQRMPPGGCSRVVISHRRRPGRGIAWRQFSAWTRQAQAFMYASARTGFRAAKRSSSTRGMSAMDAKRFDHLAAVVGRAAARRGVLGALVGGLAGLAGLAAGPDVAGKKRKKKCKSGTKKCGKRCIPLNGCCDAGECPNGEACRDNRCTNCVSAADCPAPPACSVSVCREGRCRTTPLATGDPCSTGLFCTTDETCDGAGVCTGGVSRDCGSNQHCDTNAGCVCDDGYTECGGQCVSGIGESCSACACPAGGTLQCPSGMVVCVC